MFKNKYQAGIVSLFNSTGSSPLAIWETLVQNGHIKRILDKDVGSLVLEVMGFNVATTYMSCPSNPKISLGIKQPFLVIIAKNLKKYFTFEITILDDGNMRRRFRASNFQSTTRVGTFCTTMPIGLSDGWNQIQFNLADFTRRAYGSQYMETVRIQIHANVRLRRVYLCDRLYLEDELPMEYRLYLPVKGRPRIKGLRGGPKAALKATPPPPPVTPPNQEEQA